MLDGYSEKKNVEILNLGVYAKSKGKRLKSKIKLMCVGDRRKGGSREQNRFS